MKLQNVIAYNTLSDEYNYLFIIIYIKHIRSCDNTVHYNRELHIIFLKRSLQQMPGAFYTHYKIFCKHNLKIHNIMLGA